MQESIIILCLAIAVGYLGVTFYKKTRQKNSGCCGCGGECSSKKHSSCANSTAEATQPFVPHKPTESGKASVREAQKSV